MNLKPVNKFNLSGRFIQYGQIKNHTFQEIFLPIIARISIMKMQQLGKTVDFSIAKMVTCKEAMFGNSIIIRS